MENLLKNKKLFDKTISFLSLKNEFEEDALTFYHNILCDSIHNFAPYLLINKTSFLEIFS